MSSTEAKRMSARSRVLLSEEGIEKIISIYETLKKYGDMTASQLVDLTHLCNTPWNGTYKGNMYERISDDCIIKYHINEQ